MVKGALMHANTGHHHTPMLVQVENIAPPPKLHSVSARIRSRTEGKRQRRIRLVVVPKIYQGKIIPRLHRTNNVSGLPATILSMTPSGSHHSPVVSSGGDADLIEFCLMGMARDWP